MRYRKGFHHFASVIVIRGLLSSSVNFYMLIFLSETTLPIGTKVVRNVHWIVLCKVDIFFPLEICHKKRVK